MPQLVLRDFNELLKSFRDVVSIHVTPFRKKRAADGLPRVDDMELVSQLPDERIRNEIFFLNSVSKNLEERIKKHAISAEHASEIFYGALLLVEADVQEKSVKLFHDRLDVGMGITADTFLTPVQKAACFQSLNRFLNAFFFEKEDSRYGVRQERVNGLLPYLVRLFEISLEQEQKYINERNMLLPEAKPVVERARAASGKLKVEEHFNLSRNVHVVLPDLLRLLPDMMPDEWAGFEKLPDESKTPVAWQKYLQFLGEACTELRKGEIDHQRVKEINELSPERAQQILLIETLRKVLDSMKPALSYSHKSAILAGAMYLMQPFIEQECKQSWLNLIVECKAPKNSFVYTETGKMKILQFDAHALENRELMVACFNEFFEHICLQSRADKDGMTMGLRKSNAFTLGVNNLNPILWFKLIQDELLKARLEIVKQCFAPALEAVKAETETKTAVVKVGQVIAPPSSDGSWSVRKLADSFKFWGNYQQAESSGSAASHDAVCVVENPDGSENPVQGAALSSS